MVQGMETCDIDGCDRPVKVKARKWCGMHYQRWQQHGTPLWEPSPLPDIATRFWRNVERRGDGECWPWTGGVSGCGYGAFKVYPGELGNERVIQPNHHRVAFRLTHGRWPEPMGLHGCDNRLCSNAVNPAHVHEGTSAQNAQEMWARGRAVNPPGEDSRNGKLTNAQAEEIRQRYAADPARYGWQGRRIAGISQGDLAAEYGVSRPRISDIIRHITYDRTT